MINKKGISLIETTIVILIVATLAIAAIPRYLDLRLQAVIGSEDAIIGALRQAVVLRRIDNMLRGANLPYWWPTQNPFTLLAQAPPYRTTGSSRGDGRRWYCVASTLLGVSIWMMYCPHYNSSITPARGELYVYSYSGEVVYNGVRHSRGEIWQYPHPPSWRHL